MVNGSVFKEREYREQQATTTPEPSVADRFMGTLGEIRQDFVQFGDALSVFPLRSALTVVGTLTVAFIAFKVAMKFGSISSELTKKLRS
jgi:hypothetical protein